MPLTPNVLPGQPVASTWGNEIRDKSLQTFASKSNLDAEWPNAPDGSEALTLDNYRLWIRRGGRWLPPLTLPLGLYYDAHNDAAVDRSLPGVPGIEDWAGTFAPSNLYTNRVVEVIFSARYELKSGTSTAFGAVINVRGTGADIPLVYHANNATFAGGQEACVFGWPFGGVGTAYRSATMGLFRTAGTPGQELVIQFQHVMLGAPAGSVINVSQRELQVVDLGPA